MELKQQGMGGKNITREALSEVRVIPLVTCLTKEIATEIAATGNKTQHRALKV